MGINITSALVDDQDKVLTFYTDVLGFLKKTEISLASRSRRSRSPTYAPNSSGSGRSASASPKRPSPWVTSARRCSTATYAQRVIPRNQDSGVIYAYAGSRSPASVTLTSRRTAAWDGRVGAALRACRQ